MINYSDSNGITKIQFFKELIKDPERKSFIRITFEFLYLFVVLRAFPGHYFSRYLFKQGKTNILDYYPWKFLYRMKSYFNNNEYKEVLENKLYFDLFYRQYSLKLPDILMFNHKNIFTINRRVFEVKNYREFKELLEDIFKNNPSSDSLIIKKTCSSYGGDKVYKIFSNQLRNDPEQIERLYLTVIKSGYLFQAVVKQHAELNRLNPSCLNTIRFDTYIDPEGKVDIVSGYLRMSIRNSHVDNIRSGGLLVGIDIETGKLKKEGFSQITNVGIKTFTEHPVTKTTFNNFTIPFFNESKGLVKKAALLMPDLRLVGWDVAIGESGPVLIEGNSDYDNTGNDFSEGGYGTNKIFTKKVLKEYEILRKKRRISGS